MPRRKGYFLLGLLLAFSILALSGTVAVFEQDTRLKRFAENEVKANLDSLRRAIDLYRHQKNPTRDPNDELEKLLASTTPETAALEVVKLLAAHSLLRGRTAWGSSFDHSTPNSWRLVGNKVKNPSFEEDSGVSYAAVGGWKGNFTPGDGVPDGWQLKADGAEQYLQLDPATYVVSFWSRAASATARVKIRIWKDPEPIPRLEIPANSLQWRRAHNHFSLDTTEVVRLEVTIEGTNPGDVAFVDGIMIEPWPSSPDFAGKEPVPSAWTRDYSVVSVATASVLQAGLLAELVGTTGISASMGYLFEW